MKIYKAYKYELKPNKQQRNLLEQYAGTARNQKVMDQKCSMGPKCPHCQETYEWTESEIRETVFCPKTYFCNFCYGIFVLDEDEIFMLQEQARKTLGFE